MFTKFLQRNCHVLLLVLTVQFMFHSCMKLEHDVLSPTLTVAFEAAPRQVKMGDTVRFKDVSEGLPTRWNWSFEGGNPGTSIAHSPSVIYDTPGSYAVTLKVARERATDSVTHTEFVVVGYADVTADFNASETTITEGEGVTFTDLSIGFPNAWDWEFTTISGHTIVSEEQHPDIVFEEPGIYTVKLRASNPESSNEVIKEDFLIVMSANAAMSDFSVSANSIIAGNSISFDDRSTGDVIRRQWTFEGGMPHTSEEQNPTVAYTAPGRYAVTLEAFDVVTSSVKTEEGYILVVPSEDLVAYFPFDGNAQDMGPIAIHPENRNNVVFNGESRGGTFGQTAVFNRASQQVLLVPDEHSGFNFGTGDYTVSLWIRTPLTTVTQMQVWAESGAGGAGDNQTWLRVGQNTTTQLIRFCIEGGGGSNIISSNFSIFNTAWHHVVCVREGQTTRIYVNGNQIGQANAPALRPVSNAQPFKIGAQQTASGFSNYFDGQMDDFLVYKRALSEAEVEALYDLK